MTGKDIVVVENLLRRQDELYSFGFYPSGPESQRGMPQEIREIETRLAGYAEMMLTEILKLRKENRQLQKELKAYKQNPSQGIEWQETTHTTRVEFGTGADYRMPPVDKKAPVPVATRKKRIRRRKNDTQIQSVGQRKKGNASSS